MEGIHKTSHLKMGTWGGTLLAISANMGDELLRTAVLAAVGAVTSFLISLGMKWLCGVWRRRRG